MSDPSSEDFYTTEVPQSSQRMIDAMRGAILAHTAELMFLEVADELLHGRHFLNGRSSDKSLLGFCDGSGNILGSTAAILSHVRCECESLSPGEAEEFMETLSKRLVAHYYATILRLRGLLLKHPVVIDREVCRTFLDGCISRVPVNSLPVYCPCHTDPLRPELEKAIARYTTRR